MSTQTIRPAYEMWPQHNRRLRDVIGAMTDEQLAIRSAPDRWPTSTIREPRTNSCTPWTRASG